VKVDKQTHKVLWRFVIKSDPKDRPMFQQPQVHDTPIVADGMVYFTAQTSRVYAVDAQTGKLRWARDFHAQLWPLKMANDVLYANPEWGEPGGNIDVSIYALDPANGATKTTYKETGQQVAGIFNGIMYLIGGGTVTAVKTSNGQQIWQTPVDAKELRINANVYLKNSTLYASLASVSENTTNTTQESYILTLDAQSGRITWRSPKINGSILDIAVGDDGRIYCGTQNHYVYAFDPRLKSLKELWKYRTIGPIYPAPIVQDGIVYVGQSSADEQNGNDDHLVALAAASGQQIWATPLKGYTKGGDTEPLVLHNGVIYLGTAGGLQGFATDSGKQVMLIPSDLLVSKKDVGNSGLFGGIAITIVD
jgi:outer membrane protein assembly factor BamB